LAHYLGGMGVRAEQLVGVCIERSVEYIVTILGILKAGGAYLPLEPNDPPQRLAELLRDAGVEVALTTEQLQDRFQEYSGRVVCLDREQETIGSRSRSNVSSCVGPDHLAYVIYTSGSTGRPKGVMVAHGALVNYTEMMCRELEMSSADRVLQFA